MELRVKVQTGNTGRSARRRASLVEIAFASVPFIEGSRRCSMAIYCRCVLLLSSETLHNLHLKLETAAK